MFRPRVRLRLALRQQQLIGKETSANARRNWAGRWKSRFPLPWHERSRGHDLRRSRHIFLCEAGDAIVTPTDMCNDIFVIMSGVVTVRRKLPDAAIGHDPAARQVYAKKPISANGPRTPPSSPRPTPKSSSAAPRPRTPETQHPPWRQTVHNMGSARQKYA
jgi:hypothetical protein